MTITTTMPTGGSGQVTLSSTLHRAANKLITLSTLATRDPATFLEGLETLESELGQVPGSTILHEVLSLPGQELLRTFSAKSHTAGLTPIQKGSLGNFSGGRHNR